MPLTENAKIFDFELEAEDVKALDDANFAATDCGYHDHQHPQVLMYLEAVPRRVVMLLLLSPPLPTQLKRS